VISGIIKDYKKMEFKAGVIEGAFYDAEGLKLIASLPTKDVLIARFLGSIQSPLGKLVRTFKAVADAMEDGSPATKSSDGDAAPASDTVAADAAIATAPAAGATVTAAVTAADVTATDTASPAKTTAAVDKPAADVTATDTASPAKTTATVD
jgi:large subunit ribosomal protein L10